MLNSKPIFDFLYTITELFHIPPQLSLSKLKSPSLLSHSSSRSLSIAQAILAFSLYLFYLYNTLWRLGAQNCM